MLSKPTILISKQDAHLLDEVILAANAQFGECSWLGIGKVLSPGIVQVEELVFPKQENSTGSSDMDPADLSACLLEACTAENERNVVWWGHSHGTMSTFFSGTDEATWKEWITNPPKTLFATVHNIKKELYTRLCIGELDIPILHNPFVGQGEDTTKLTEILGKMRKPELKTAHYLTTQSYLGTRGKENGTPVSTLQNHIRIIENGRTIELF